MIRGRDPTIYLPRSTEFFRVVNDTLIWSKGIHQAAPYLTQYLEESGHFVDIHRRRVEMPIGGDLLGEEFRQVMRMYAESMKVMLLEAGGRTAEEIDELVRGFLYEVNNVPGMVSIYYAVHARKRL